MAVSVFMMAAFCLDFLVVYPMGTVAYANRMSLLHILPYFECGFMVFVTTLRKDLGLLVIATQAFTFSVTCFKLQYLKRLVSL